MHEFTAGISHNVPALEKMSHMARDFLFKTDKW